jgi:adenylosuccinate lyase
MSRSAATFAEEAEPHALTYSASGGRDGVNRYNQLNVISRYTPREIAAVFSEESRLHRWLDVELRVCEGWVEEGVVPRDALPALSRAKVDPERVAQLEAEQGHDLAAFVSAVQESVGEDGRYLHLGLTSSDVVDTALATQLRDAAAIIDSDLASLEIALRDQALAHRHTIMPGRTHGVHAEPITLGVKFANHYDEVVRSRQRLRAAAEQVSVGQISGAVGTHASVPATVEEYACRALGLGVAAATTQVIARDRHADFVNALALVGAVEERLATTIRLLQITEVDEAGEAFGEKQKGSSAMPHKRNPILCERICGLAKLLRGFAVTAMENVALWHERDISHSSAERVILPDACAATAYMTRIATRVVTDLRIDTEKMRQDVFHLGGIAFSQRVLNALIEAGWAREKAYRTVQALAKEARDSRGSFRDLVRASSEITGSLTQAAIDECFDVESQLANIDVTYERLGLTKPVAATTPATRGDAA